MGWAKRRFRETRNLRALLAWCVVGWGTWIRTKTNRVRVCCATVTPFPKGLLSRFNGLWNCSATAPLAADRLRRWPPFYSLVAALGKSVAPAETRRERQQFSHAARRRRATARTFAALAQVEIRRCPASSQPSLRRIDQLSRRTHVARFPRCLAP